MIYPDPSINYHNYRCFLGFPQFVCAIYHLFQVEIDLCSNNYIIIELMTFINDLVWLLCVLRGFCVQILLDK